MIQLEDYKKYFANITFLIFDQMWDYPIESPILCHGVCSEWLFIKINPWKTTTYHHWEYTIACVTGSRGNYKRGVPNVWHHSTTDFFRVTTWNAQLMMLRKPCYIHVKIIFNMSVSDFGISPLSMYSTEHIVDIKHSVMCNGFVAWC